MKKYLYLYNPFSGSQASGHDLDRILGTFYKNQIYAVPHRLFSMENDPMLDTLLSDRDAFDAVIISGGDGTVGQMIDKMIKYGNDTPIGIMPSGTCNDFARNLMMPASIADCLNVFCAGKSDQVDLLKIITDDTEQYICNSIAAGVLVGVSHTTSPEFKKVFGSLAYYIAALGELADMKTFNITVETEKESIQAEALVFAVLNGTDVGGMKNLISEADIKDGLMNIMVVKNCNPVERAAVGINLLAHKGDKNIISLNCNRCKITVDRDMDVSCDGEKGPKLPFAIENIRQKLNVIVPDAFLNHENEG